MTYHFMIFHFMYLSISNIYPSLSESHRTSGTFPSASIDPKVLEDGSHGHCLEPPTHILPQLQWSVPPGHRSHQVVSNTTKKNTEISSEQERIESHLYWKNCYSQVITSKLRLKKNMSTNSSASTTDASASTAFRTISSAALATEGITTFPRSLLVSGWNNTCQEELHNAYAPVDHGFRTIWSFIKVVVGRVFTKHSDKYQTRKLPRQVFQICPRLSITWLGNFLIAGHCIRNRCQVCWKLMLKTKPNGCRGFIQQFF